MTDTARLNAHRSVEYRFNTDGTPGFTAIGLSEEGQLAIKLLNWVEAAKEAVALTRKYHSDIQADTLARHHDNVSALAHTHGWLLTRKYDVQQHQGVVDDLRMDVGPLDYAAVSLLSRRPSLWSEESAPAATVATPTAAVAMPMMYYPPDVRAGTAYAEAGSSDAVH
ncbi:hypothetical protein GLOTRDRAFT_127766 [Gloeophyllum trabeum ATCC 11539]|uniref:Uncharacterized protein n=1 Tax=Gloeophyllum trabeum (strain ATCC 11539 / FP-39264 / Madison 617) TaxID=670483 RepID=S7QDE7_GLOTA|nr:uncharacterized protein GLOTRDRAFT_127766 [Gloeophyllum trabeum ATCC 11539]EPQ57413.1 hypothetical protein GLOTRDRAFT_127766 [Gloeophyllum trabeum ATCC 11539]